MFEANRPSVLMEQIAIVCFWCSFSRLVLAVSIVCWLAAESLGHFFCCDWWLHRCVCPFVWTILSGPLLSLLLCVILPLFSIFHFASFGRDFPLAPVPRISLGVGWMQSPPSSPRHMSVVFVTARRCLLLRPPSVSSLPIHFVSSQTSEQRRLNARTSMTAFRISPSMRIPSKIQKEEDQNGASHVTMLSLCLHETL